MLKNITKLTKIARMRHLFGTSVRLPLALALLAGLIISNVDWGVLFDEGPPAVVEGRPKVRDGDSLVIGRRRVRLKGIDAPEREQTCKRGGQTWACGRAARRHLQRLIANRGVVCKVAKRDRFDRLLAHCRAGPHDLNRTMVRDGMAVSFDGKYRGEEAEARRRRTGMWAGQFQRPKLWRQSNPRR